MSLGLERKKTMKKWTQIRVACSISDLDTVCAVMSMIDNGLMIEDANEVDHLDHCYGELIEESLKTADRTVGAVSVYVPEERNPAECVSFIRERLTDVKYDLTLSGMSEEDWADSWKKYYKPVRIGKRLMVVPSWEEYEAEEGDIILRMDPGMAFGTGTHETTRLCSSIMEEYVKSGDRVLDIGTGSGILAIAASKLGARSVFAYDIDPVAVRVASENCAENGCKNITCGIADLLRGVDTAEKYDFVSANIVADILVRLAPDVASYMKDGGLIAVSGIIDSQEDRVREALEKGGLTHIFTAEENDWNAMLFRK